MAMKHSTKLAVFWLPIMVAVVLLGWLLLGALPGMKMTGDLVSWLMELPVTTCYAMGAGVATLLTMQISGINLDNVHRSTLMERAQNGDRNARDALNDEAKATLAVLLIWAVFFFPHW